LDEKILGDGDSAGGGPDVSSVANRQPRMLKMTLAYDGTAYVGWQRQAEGVSIQGLVEEAMARLEGGPVTVTGAGRTDAGVHAIGQVASVRVTSTHAADVYLRALNAALPEDVRVRRVEQVPDSFHARFDVRHKTYRYRILNAPIASPFELRYAWHLTFPLDLDAMRVALAACEGQHDFAAFQASGSVVSGTIRTIHRAMLAAEALDDADCRLLTLTVTGDGFLRHMVRNLTGTLVDIGRGRWPASEMARFLTSRDRGQTGRTAPPQGLFLVDVAY
jgi:tRNA pseudouridine38-40 synthase